jgi:hypothetical protein
MKSIAITIIGISCALLTLSCAPEEKKETDDLSIVPTIIEVTAKYDPENDRHLFDTDTDAVPSGWTTFRLVNASPMVHFLFLDHLPGDRTSKQLLSEISPIFQEAADLIAAGKAEEGMGKFAELPEWFNDLIFRGGPGFVSPGRTIEATLYLEPGNYVMECYIKTADGVFHWNLGMYKDLRVTEETSSARPPENPTIEITVTDEGLEIVGDVVAGKHLVAVHFAQETPALVAKDVHVVRLDEGVNIDEVALWMDFLQPEGQISTMAKPAPALFLGGVHEMPNGNTAYFEVDFAPGNYAWISEQPAADALYSKFTVAAAPGE